jgi:predicted alpha/beta hydrolase family esterase
MHYLIVPGLNNSGPSHWQTFWAKSLPNASRVYQRCWDKPQKEEWIDTLDETVKQLKGDTILVSHSLGSVTTVFWLLQAQERHELPANIKGAFLVAPADTDVVESISNFAPMPLGKLPVPTCIVGSENDPYMTYARVEFFAKSWGAKLFNAGALGHINSDCNLGEWEQGRKFLAEFERTL